MALRISVFDSKELQTAILAIRSMDRELRTEIRKHTRTAGREMWQEAIGAHVLTHQEARVLMDTARVQVSDQNVMLQSARIGRTLRGGVKPAEIAHHVEFGADPNFKRTVVSKNGKRYERHTRRQFRARNRKGYVVYPAAALTIPRLASLWVQTAIRTFYETLEVDNHG